MPGAKRAPSADAKAKPRAKPSARTQKASKKAQTRAPAKSAKAPGRAATGARKPTPDAPTAGRRTGIPKSDGDAGVQAYINGLPTWQADIARRIDAIVEREVPGVRKAIKWSSPMYGLPETGWFAALGGFKSYVKLNFFAGASLRPIPPSGEGKAMRSLDIREGELDERQVAAWVRQAAAIPGWGKV